MLTKIFSGSCRVFLFIFPVVLLPQVTYGATVTYQYDTLGRVESVNYNDGSNILYVYDAVGNRTNVASGAATQVIYEDAENGDIVGWDVYDSDPVGAMVNNVSDSERNSRVVELSGTEMTNGYRLRNPDGSWWNNDTHGTLEWTMKYSEDFVIYVAVQTTNGFRYIYYTAANYNNLGEGAYIHHGLGSIAKNGSWQTFIRDLEYDLKDAQPDNNLESILGFLIRGSGRVDDIKTLTSIPVDQDSDSDGITDLEEINTYGTMPYSADSDNDGITDLEEISYWGSSWNEDPDGDGLINILDPDSDNDGFSDGTEVEQDTDPGDSGSVITILVYEDSEDQNSVGWEVYDTDPVGAVISNVDDLEKGGRVIEFSGTATSNGYRLRNPDGTWWNNSVQQIIEWSLNYSESFVVYVAVQTTDGFRYIYYTPVDYDQLGEATYIHHGLGTRIKDGSWHTFIRDLEYDLKDAQPDNNLESILGFLIRGSGKVDDIKTLTYIPADLDSDNDGLTDLEEINIYGTLPYNADSDNDGIMDMEEIVYWNSSWNTDPDEDGLINILDPDSDNDGFSDGVEIEQGSDPADPDSVIISIIYEDGEDQSVAGWEVYDKDPAGATISNTWDSEKGSQVIEFSGSGGANGYRLRNPDGSWWNNDVHKTIEWSLNYSENFTVYIAVQTIDGFRYINYTTANQDNLGDDTYIHHGLGTSSKDGTWHTFNRDLEQDLQDAQPGNSVESILGFLIRGSGRVDDIKTLE